MTQPQRWSIILHGGCSNSCPEVKTQLAIRQNLASVLDVAATALKSGAVAREVVCQAVAALEDCPLYNSGKGSALTLEGDYEVFSSYTKIYQKSSANSELIAGSWSSRRSIRRVWCGGLSENHQKPSPCSKCDPPPWRAQYAGWRCC